jgi:hypothetical protein
MAMQPPFIDGVMELTDEEKAQFKEQLVAIRDAFVETDEQPVCDTFYITSTYNREHSDAPINGDTCVALLSEEIPQSEV